MRIIGPRTTPTGEEEASPRERGAVLLLTVFLMVVFMGMAAFAVDLGWLYFRDLQVKKAAEASALAGAIHLPLPAGVTMGPGAEAFDSAVAVAAEHGYGSGAVNVGFCDTQQQIKVSIGDNAKTFFMRVFGIQNVDLDRWACAEALPPLKLGSDESHLGTVPGVHDEHFWVGINGQRRRKEDGDPFSTRCYLGNGTCTSANLEYRNGTSYYYAVEVPDANVGQALDIQVYDGPHNPPASNTGDRSSGNDRLTFDVFRPDQTPGTWTDNSDHVCGPYSFDPGDPTPNGWETICTDTARKGIYVVHLKITQEDTAISDFSLRTLTNGNPEPPSNQTAVFGLGDMSLDMVEAGVAPTFKLAKLLPIYAGTVLQVSLFDAGDVQGGFANLRFLGSLAGVDCEYRVRDGADGLSLVQNWTADDTPGSAPCFLNTSGQRFNNQWLDFRFVIPTTYSCTGQACWVEVDYNFSAAANVTERTTWQVKIIGQPVHLLPGG